MTQRLNARTTTPKEAIITIFPPLPGSGRRNSSCSCHPGVNFAGCGEDPMVEFQQQLAELKQTLAGLIQIEEMEYTTVLQARHAVDKLNAALKASGSEVTVSFDNLGDVLVSAAPITALNDRIIALGSIPTRAQMLHHLKSS